MKKMQKGGKCLEYRRNMLVFIGIDTYPAWIDRVWNTHAPFPAEWLRLHL